MEVDAVPAGTGKLMNATVGYIMLFHSQSEKAESRFSVVSGHPSTCALES